MMEPLGTTVDAETLERGSTVSINLTRQPVLGVPGFMLSPDYPTGTVPDSIEDSALAMLRRAHDAGLIVLASQPVGKEVHVNNYNEVFKLIDELPTIDKLPSTVYRIHKDYLKKFDGMTMSQLMRKIVEHEGKNQCRGDVINWFMGALDRTGGISEISEETDRVEQVSFKKEPGQSDIDALRRAGVVEPEVVIKVDDKELEDLF